MAEIKNVTPLVSIGLPVYNGEQYLEESINSILTQSFTDFELIIADNASTDRTQDICRNYARSDSRVRYYRNSQNLGAAPNHNLVLELSRGVYFKWASYDDVLEIDFIARTVSALDSNPDAVLCFSRAKLIDEYGTVIENYDPLPNTDYSRPELRFRNLVLAPDQAVQVLGLMRSDVIRGKIVLGCYPSSDEVFLAHLALLGSFVEIPERLLKKRMHPKQSTKGALASQRARVLFFDTSAEGKVVLIKWLYFKGCTEAIRNSAITSGQRIYCYYQMLHWLLIPKNFKSMAKDLLLYINGIIPIFSNLEREVKEITKRANN